MKAFVYEARPAGWEGEEMIYFYCVPEMGFHMRAHFGITGEGTYRVLGRCDGLSCQGHALDARAIEMLEKARLPKRYRKTRDHREKILQKLGNVSIFDLDLPVRVVVALRVMGAETLFQVSRLTRDDFKSKRSTVTGESRFSDKTLDQIENTLLRFGLHLRDSGTNPV